MELAAKERAQVSASKADVRASIYPGGSYSHHLLIENRGAATATNVNIEFVNPEHESIFPEGERDRHLPIDELGGNDHVQMIASLVMGRYPPFDVILTWTDPDGTPQQRATKLRLS